ncbi:MAG: hypothetical protein ACP5M9_03240 [Candidatus Micrarchaeia archaeon]
MNFEKSKNLKAIAGVFASVMVTLTVLGMVFGMGYATSTSSNTIAASANVLSTCYISLSPNTIAFGGSSGVIPGITTSSNEITDSDSNGNIAANVLVYANDWTGPSPSVSYAFSGTYTETNAITGSYEAVPNSISSIALTDVIIPAPTLSNPTTSNSLYFELVVPGGLGPGVYSQTITIENSC